MRVLLCGSLLKSIYSFRIEYVNLLLNKGYDLEIVASSSDLNKDSFYIDYFRKRNVKLHIIERGSHGIFNFINYILFFLGHKGSYDLKIVFTPIAIVSFTLTSLFSKGKLVVYYTGMGVMARWPFFAFNYVINLNSTKFIVQNFEDYKLLKSHGFNVTNAGVTGVDIIKSKGLNDRQAKTNVAYIGRIIPAKGRDILYGLIEFFGLREAYNVHFQVAGFCDAKTHEYLINLMEKYPNALSYHGMLNSNIDVDKLLKACDLLIYPTVFNEGVPRSMQEAMRLGLPVISNKNRGVNEILLEDYNGIYCEYSFESYKSKLLEYILMDEQNRQRISKRNINVADWFCNVELQSRLLLKMTLID